MSDAPASLYFGSVMHARLKPVGHRFTYRVASLLIDIDQTEAAHRLSPLFSVDRFNLFAFYHKDHVPAPEISLRAHVEHLLRDAGVTDVGSIQLLCYPRVLGYVFNPLSIYFCHDGSGALAALIYEVRNTFGERHSYVAPIRAEEISAAGIRQEREKLFYVSPFLGMAMRYKFRIRPPAETIAVRILECDGDGPILSATFHGERTALDTRSLAKLFVSIPLQSICIVAAIYWQALKLWMKGVKLQSRPEAPPAASVDGLMIDDREHLDSVHA